ncbi:hypothetical protein [Ghiorsea bivora]|uniref:hypothetical protein n=1 Tax=Ghiorsea bivora TaxID=1485545 RepID=UPI00056E0F06|nr:hypothetical protein [Ghiorsea bivora]
MKKLLLLTLGCFSLLLSACGTEDGGPATISTVAPPAPSTVMEALFAPSSDPAVPSVLPSPNNAAFAGTTDGTLNIPVVDPNDLTDPIVAINTLDGFSTVASSTTAFAEALDATTVAAAVHVYDTSSGTPVELVFGQDYVALPNPNDATVLVVKPLKPLRSATNYLVVVTNDLKSVTGKPASSSQAFALMKSPVPLVDANGVSQVPGVPDSSAIGLEGLRQTVLPALDTAQAYGITKDKVAVAWSFKTQTIGKVLQTIQVASATDPYASVATNFLTVPAIPSAGTGGLGVLDFYSFALLAQASTGSTALIDGYTAGSFANVASVVIGAVNMPYYLDEYSAANPFGPLTGHFQLDANGLPITKSVQTIPFLMSIPNAAPIGGGAWPVVIFQHGFTVDKSVMFGIANTLAQAGFVTIAIDAVMHGDRTFNVDYLTEVFDPYSDSFVTTAAVPDGTPDSSGAHYLNLKYLLTTRDNARQSVADLIHLTRLIETQTNLDLVSNTTGLLGVDGVPDINMNNISYVGHSNGGMLGMMLASVEPAIKTFVLANPGGGYSDIFQNSVEVSPIVNAGLQASGVIIGSADYYSFLGAVQTVGDDADPINYGIVYNDWKTANNQNIFILKTTPDFVVPNSATDALISVLGLPQVGLALANAPFAGSGYVNYLSGLHSTFLTPLGKPDPITTQKPLSYLPATTEMQTATATFLGSAQVGTPLVTVTTTDPLIVE